MPAAKDSQKNPIQVVERMMKLLDVLAGHPEPIGLKQIAREVAVSPLMRMSTFPRIWEYAGELGRTSLNHPFISVMRRSHPATAPRTCVAVVGRTPHASVRTPPSAAVQLPARRASPAFPGRRFARSPSLARLGFGQ